jgi:hypothetical protein
VLASEAATFDFWNTPPDAAEEAVDPSELAPDVLAGLASAGFPIGIICDVGWTIIVTGVLEGLRVADPTRPAHVGDLRRTDGAGALVRGVVAIRYTGDFDDRSAAPDANHLIDNNALHSVLGV